MKIRTLIVWIIIAVIALAICITTSLTVIRCTAKPKMNIPIQYEKQAEVRGTSAIYTGVNTMEVNNFQDRVDYIKEVNGELMYPKIIPIGAWNMVANSTKQVAHGLGVNFRKICAVSVTIHDDVDDNIHFATPGIPGFATALQEVYIVGVTATVFSLSRRGGGWYDSADYDDALMNRGDLLVWFRT